MIGRVMIELGAKNLKSAVFVSFYGWFPWLPKVREMELRTLGPVARPLEAGAGAGSPKAGRCGRPPAGTQQRVQT